MSVVGRIVVWLFLLPWWLFKVLLLVGKKFMKCFPLNRVEEDRETIYPTYPVSPSIPRENQRLSVALPQYNSRALWNSSPSRIWASTVAYLGIGNQFNSLYDTINKRKGVKNVPEQKTDTVSTVNQNKPRRKTIRKRKPL